MMKNPFPQLMSRNLLLVLNGSMHAVSQVIRTAVAFLTIPIVLNYLGKEAFGIWMIALSFLSLIGFMQGGVSGALINLIAKSKRNLNAISQTLAATLSLTLLLALSISVIAAIVAIYCPWERLFSSEGIVSQRELSLLIFILCSSAGFSIVALVPKFALIGSQQAYWAHSIDIIATLISGGLVIAAALTKQPMWLLAIAFSFGRQVPLFLIGIGFLKFKLKLKGLLKFQLNKSTTRILLGAGSLLTIIQISHALANHADLTLIGIYSDLSGAADYALVQKLFTLPVIIMSFINLALWPAFTKAKAEGDPVWIMRIFRRNLFITTLAASLFAICMGLAVNWLLKYWVGGSTEVGALLILGMVLKTIIIVPISNVNNLLKSLGLFKFIAVLAACMVIINVPISIFLIKQIGAAGAVFGSVIAYTIFLLIPYIISAPKLISESLESD